MRASERIRLLVLIYAIFFSISLITNILGPVIPELIRVFQLRLSVAALLPFSLFVAYGLFSVPAGLLVERYRERAVVLLAFGLILAGAVAFAALHTYAFAIGSLFVMGVGMALLQVALNPLLRVVGGEARFAWNAVLVQLIFGVASFLSPFLYSLLATREGSAPSFVALYWIFAAIAATMMGLVARAQFPTVTRTAEEQAGSARIYGSLLRRPLVWAYFVAIFAYVGMEQGVSNWISQFLATYHGVDPERAGAQAVAWFWGLMTAGCLLGLLLLRRLDSRVVLACFTVAAMGFLALALYGGPLVSRWSFALVGLSASVMWSVVFSLALNSLPEHHGAFSGILCTAIVGGAALPYAIGWMGERVGLRQAMLVLYLPLAYLLGVTRWATPLVPNLSKDD
jgi:MFS transporter, FHS family, L-fucose permease